MNSLPDDSDPNLSLLNEQSTSFGLPQAMDYLNGFVSAQPRANSAISTPPSSTVGQRPSAMGQQPLGASSIWQKGPAHQQARSHNPDYTLGQLLVMYPAVQQLHNRWTDTNEKMSLALETQSALIKENMRLAHELRELTARRHLDLFQPPDIIRTRNVSLAPSDSVSMVPSTAPTQYLHQPAIRPDHYPLSVLWSLNDSKRDEDVASSDGNLSRPAMSRVIRHPDGTDIDPGEYAAIKATAHALAYELNELPIPASKPHLKGMPRTVRFYKHHMVREWNRAIADAEEQQELLALCSAHWKAEHIIAAALRAASVTKTSSRKRSRSSSTAAATASTSASKKSKQRSPRSDGTTDRAKAKLHSGGLPQPLVPPAGKSVVGTSRFAWAPHTTSTLPVDAALSTSLPALVDPACTNLIDIISQEHPNLTNFTDAIDLLNALNVNPTFTTGEPSPSFTSFLDRIERSVPSDEDNEDDTNSSWGHDQFSGGQLSCTTVLTSWDCVGSPAFASRLIAGALTTCRVSRWLCKTNGLTSITFFVGDNYLNETCKLLWACWKSAGGPNVKGKGKEVQPPSNLSPMPPPVVHPAQDPATPVDPDTANANADLESKDLKIVINDAWTVPILRKWITAHQLVAAPNAKKAALVDIVNAATGTDRPTLSDIQTNSEKRGKNLKVAGQVGDA